MSDARIAVVVPPGSRLSTSRINFRLLAREAAARTRTLIVVTPDASVRALASAAGLQTFTTVGEYEDAEAARIAGQRAAGAAAAGGAALAAGSAAGVPGAEAAGSSAGVRGGARARAGDPGAGGPTLWDGEAAAVASVAGAAALAATTDTGRGPATPVPPPAGGTVPGVTPAGSRSAAGGAVPSVGPRSSALPATAGRPGDAPHGAALPVVPGGRARSTEPPRRRRGWRWLAILLVAVLALGAVGGVAAYATLPTATVTIRPATEPLGPSSVVVRAEPDAASVDIAAAVVPASLVEVPVEVSDTFEATGKRVEETKAAGTVTFVSKDPTKANTIAAGSIVRTAGGVGFRTKAAVTVPKAKIEGLTILPGTADVAVVAEKGGPEANVAANTIRIVPPAEDPVLLEVRNRASTKGGTRESFPKVTQKDVDAAVKTLQQRLEARFKDAVADPARVPDGMVVVPGTEELGPSTPVPEPEALVDTEVDAFDLTLQAIGTITAYSPGDVEAVAAARLASTVPEDYSLVEGSTKVDVGEATADGTAAEVDASATATMIRTIDLETVRDLAKGRSPAEAERLLAALGDVTVVIWPSFLPNVTEAADRIDVVIVTSDGGPAASPGARPGATETPSP